MCLKHDWGKGPPRVHSLYNVHHIVYKIVFMYSDGTSQSLD